MVRRGSPVRVRKRASQRRINERSLPVGRSRPMEPRVNVITLAVDDLERALAFYRDALGLPTDGVVATDLVDPTTGAAGAIVIFKLDGGLMLCLYPRSELGKDASVPTGPSQS